MIVEHLTKDQILRRLGKGAKVADLHRWQAFHAMAWTFQACAIHDANEREERRRAALRMARA